METVGAHFIGSDEHGFCVHLGTLRVIASWGLGWDHASVAEPRG